MCVGSVFFAPTDTKVTVGSDEILCNALDSACEWKMNAFSDDSVIISFRPRSESSGSQINMLCRRSYDVVNYNYIHND